MGTGGATFDVKPGERVWTDRDGTIELLAPELIGGTGIRLSQNAAATPIEFESAEPVQLLIGYFKDSAKT